MFEMREQLIKILVIALAVLLVGAGAVYAVSYLYQAETTGQVIIEEAPSQSGALPGLEISQASLDFGRIDPNYGPDANHMSNKIALTVQNTGTAKVGLGLIFDNLPEGLSVREDTANHYNSKPGTLPGTTKITVSGLDCTVAPGGSCVLHPYIVAGSDIAPGTYQFKIIVKGI